MKKAGARARALAVLVALALLMSGLWVVPAQGAGTFDGGAFEAPMYVMNDHTPFGFRWNATADITGLAPNTLYYIKVRLTAGTSPSSATNRGFTWNSATQRWVQEREGWEQFPTITTDANGKITASQWAYAKVGDENVSGDYYLMMSLSTGEAGTTLNSTVLPVVKVLDAATEGLWVHNGEALPSNTQAKRSEITSDTSETVVYSLWQTEANLVDDDSNGVVDDEDYGPEGSAGDYRMAMAPGMAFDVLTNRVPRIDGATLSQVDADIALLPDATDIMAPDAPTGLAATGGAGKVDLEWTETTDTGGSGLAGYRIYRWEKLPEGTTPPFTPVPMLIGSVDSSTTTYVDADVMTGVEYEYYVRGFDNATNVGPRSNASSAVPFGLNELSRVAGSDRYKTALEVSKATFADDSVEATVVIATGRDYPDALAASGLAGVHGSPLLLVGTSLTAELKAEIDRLGATDVVLVGGLVAIPASVETALDASYNVKRVAAPDRYGTAAAVAREIAMFGGMTDDAFFVRGDGFADALAVSPFAYSQAKPVLLVRTNVVPTPTADVIKDLGISEGGIAGGTGAISSDTEADLETLLGNPVIRWAGSDRYSTAAIAAQWHVSQAVATYGYVGIATGADFADALGGGAAAGYNGGVLLLTQPDKLSTPTATALTDNETDIDDVVVYGGTVAVSTTVYNQIAAILN